MPFRTRIIVTYTILLSFVILGLGAFFSQISLQQSKRTAERDLETLSQNISVKIDEIVRPMEFISEFLLSERNTLAGIMALSTVDRNSTEKVGYLRQAKTDIRLSLVTYCIEENFHRVSVFNGNGDFLTSNSRLSSVRDGEADLTGLHMAEAAVQANGATVLAPPHADTWDTSSPQEVFSLIRAVRGVENPSFIEVQRDASDFTTLYTPEADFGIKITVLDENGGLFYSQLSQEDTAALQQEYTSNGAEWLVNLEELEGNIFSVQYSPYTKLYTVAVQDKTAFAAASNLIMRNTLFIALAALALSLAFIFFTSIQLTRPIKKLRLQMENTDLPNLNDTLPQVRPTNEIEALNQSYLNLLQRLNQSVIREKQLSTLQVRAEFDALQAQVNPHFIYNVLNVISHRGVVSQDEEICDICENLASMLRYSTGTTQRVVTIQEELEYVQHYLYLIKTRYKDKLQYTIQIDPHLLSIPIPKIVLQQIVENSVNHGLKDTFGNKIITINGYVQGEEGCIEIRDNGSGFTKEALEDLHTRTTEMRQQAATGHLNLKMDIGGLGLLNAYARMLLLFGDDFSFTFTNNTNEDGACVILRFVLQKGGEEWNIPSSL